MSKYLIAGLLMITEQLALIILFITPGLFISSFFNMKTEFLLTSSFAIFFWGFSSFLIPMNFFINSSYFKWLIYLMFVIWIFKFKNIKNPLFNILLILLFELINNSFGVLHIVSTSQITFDSALSNLSYQSGVLGVSSIQIALLKFFNESYILLTLQQCLAISLMVFNIKSLITQNNLKAVTTLTIIPAFFIFSVLLEIMTIRTHFFASQLLCFLIIESFKPKYNRFSRGVFFLFLSLFISSRLENLIIYFPLIFLLLRAYFYNENLQNDINQSSMLFVTLLSPLIANYYGYSYSQDLRANLILLSFLVFLLTSLTIFKDNLFVEFVIRHFIIFFIASLVFLSGCLYYLFSFKAINSWLFIINHLLDTHRGWVTAVCYFIVILIYLISRTNNVKLKRVYTTFFLTFVLIIVSSPLHHSIYGGELWSSGIVEGLAIYNPFDESQTRSFLQLFLALIPFSVLISSRT